MIFDSLMENMPPAVGGETINSPTFVRAALTPLKNMVRDLGIVGVFSLHPPKARGVAFRDMVQASQAFTAIPRIGLLFAWHPDDAEDDPLRRRVLLRGGGNLGRNPGALEFRIVEQDVTYDDGSTQGREVFDDVAPSDMTVARLVAASRRRQP